MLLLLLLLLLVSLAHQTHLHHELGLHLLPELRRLDQRVHPIASHLSAPHKKLLSELDQTQQARAEEQGVQAILLVLPLGLVLYHLLQLDLLATHIARTRLEAIAFRPLDKV